MLGAATQTKTGPGLGARLSAAIAGFFSPSRVQGAAKVPDCLRHMVTDAESRVVEGASESPAGVQGGRKSPGRGWAGRVPGLGDRVLGPETLVTQGAEDTEKPCVHMGAVDLANEFVDYMLTADQRIELNTKDMLAQYWRWAREFQIHRIPDTIFLAKLGEHPEVRKGRKRLLDAKGRVVRLDTDARSPARESVYIIGDKKRARHGLPGKVPVQANVAGTPKPQPAQPQQIETQPELPLRRAA